MKTNKPNRGSVLFIVLVFIISITILVWITTQRISSEAEFVERELAKLKAYTLCLSGFEFLKNRLATGAASNIEFLDGTAGPHLPRLLMDGSDIRLRFQDIIQDKYRKHSTIPGLEQMAFIINLQDSAGLVNVFKIDRTLFKNLLEHNGRPAKDGDVILDSLYDWMDDDNFTRAHGAESDYYQEQFGYSAANRMIDSRDEILLVRGMDKNLFEKIGELLDFSLEVQGINPNTMPAPAFYLFKGIGESQIEKVMEKRLEPNGIAGVAEMTLFSGYNFSAYPETFQFFTSTTTYVKIKAQMEEKRFFYVKFRLDRKGGGGSMKKATDGGKPGPQPKKDLQGGGDFSEYFHIYNWQEGTEVQEVKKPT